MNYINHPYPFASHPGMLHGQPMEQPIAYDPAMAHPIMMHPMDGYLYPHPHFDMVDYYHQPIMDYEEYAENLSRPRLTKEQVETLEAQFQAHPKPSSNVKRQLAAQTNLSLPRVAVRDCDSNFPGLYTNWRIELVPKSTSQGEAAEATGRI
jgi:hypothetical protein